MPSLTLVGQAFLPVISDFNKDRQKTTVQLSSGTASFRENTKSLSQSFRSRQRYELKQRMRAQPESHARIALLTQIGQVLGQSLPRRPSRRQSAAQTEQMIRS